METKEKEDFFYYLSINDIIKVEEKLKYLDNAIDLKDENGNTALLIAVKNNQPTMIELLLKYKSDVNIENNSGETPLIISIKNNTPSICRLLLDNGAKIFSKNNSTEDVLEYAQDTENPQIISLIKEQISLVWDTEEKKRKVGEVILIIDNEYQKIANDTATLVTEKNIAYGNSAQTSGEILKILFPNGIPVEKYNKILIIARILDKISRICNNENAFNEEPLKDIIGYCLVAINNDNKKEEEDAE